jgi:hypothetical protein
MKTNVALLTIPLLTVTLVFAAACGGNSNGSAAPAAPGGIFTNRLANGTGTQAGKVRTSP